MSARSNIRPPAPASVAAPEPPLPVFPPARNIAELLAQASVIQTMIPLEDGLRKIVRQVAAEAAAREAGSQP